VKKLFLALAVTAALLGASPAQAYYTWFDFQRISNTASRLTMNWEGSPGHFFTTSWRAGSGTSTDACWVAHGWLPTGNYDLWGQYDHFDGSAIKGRVFRIQDKQCWNGTWRTDLFVHSEETADNGQYCPTVYDDPFCWEGDSDYYSHGCIKISRAGYPSDLALAHDAWHQKSWDNRHGPFTINDWLYVHD
jgi:hypothetical protein